MVEDRGFGLGRRKTYDRDDVAQRAMAVFWQHGYEATTIQQLETSLQINRYSLFAEFGSKEGLFEAALDVYEACVVSANLGPLEATGAGIEDILAFFQRFNASPPDAVGVGCMLCNAAVERSPDAPGVRQRSLRYFERLRAALRNALQSTLEEPARSTSAAALASAILGGFLQARGGADRAALIEALDGLTHWVRSLDRR